MGEPGAGFLLGGDGVEGSLQVITYRRYGILGVEERDRVLELAAEASQLERGQRVQGMLGRVYCWRLLGECGGWHRRSLRAYGDVIRYPTCQARATVGSTSARPPGLSDTAGSVN